MRFIKNNKVIWILINHLFKCLKLKITFWNDFNFDNLNIFMTVKQIEIADH